MPIETLLYVSFGLNLTLFFTLWYRNYKALKAKDKQPSMEILEILHDIAGHGTILEIRRVDPMSVFQVSPHDRGR